METKRIYKMTDREILNVKKGRALEGKIQNKLSELNVNMIFGDKYRMVRDTDTTFHYMDNI